MTTQFVSASYQEIIDLHTESDRVSILGFHTPANSQPIRMLGPFWEAYQKVRYRGCSMALVPAARLPADPSQVSYGAGEPPIDPRDLLNPILFHGCHGNDLGSILNQFYAGGAPNSDVDRLFSDSMDQNLVYNRVGDETVYESLYYRALTDNTWLKAHPQRGFKKSMRPMVYRVAVNTPQNPNNVGGNRTPSIFQVSEFAGGRGPIDGSLTDGTTGQILNPGTMGADTGASNYAVQMKGQPGLQTTTTTAQGPTVSNPVVKTAFAMFTPGIRPLGWIETRQPAIGAGTTTPVLSGDAQSDAQYIQGNYDANDRNRNMIPKVFMGICLLPPAYKTEQYFRIVLNHHFDFAKYRGTSMRPMVPAATVPNVVNMYNSLTNSKGVDDNGVKNDDKGILDD